MKTGFRSDRIFRLGSQWYFRTREGIDIGPFNSEFQAQVESSILSNVVKDKSPPAARAAMRKFLLEMSKGSSKMKGVTHYVAKQGRF